jgi:hypothetical protein
MNFPEPQCNRLPSQSFPEEAAELVSLTTECKRLHGPGIARPSPRTRPICRRLFLKGIGGVSLGLPFLPSMATKQAFALDAVIPGSRNFYYLGTGHGGAFTENMFPADAMMTQQMDLRAGHKIRWGMLTPSQQGQQTVLSPVLRANSSALSPALLAKMNVMNGFDIPFRMEHHTGGHLGNYDAFNRATGDPAIDPRPTIDQFMAYTPSFYRDLSGVRERSMLIGASQGLSWGYSNPTAMTGIIQQLPQATGTKALFDKIFVPAGTNPPVTAAPRPSIISRVLENYKRLRDGNRRLSASDRQRLDDHISRINELDRKLNVSSKPTGASCSNTKAITTNSQAFDVTDAASLRRHAQLYNNVVVAAYACGSSRIAVFNCPFESQAVSYGAGSWHQDVAHNWAAPAAQQLLVSSYQFIFENIFVDLASKLNSVEDAPGVTLLDNSLLAWSQEDGMATHSSVSYPIVTFGGAGGFFKTGRFVDYRNRENRIGISVESGRTTYCGILRSQWLANALLSMGVPASEFERWGHKGYGAPSFLGNVGAHADFRKYHESLTGPYFQMSSDKLAVLT